MLCYFQNVQTNSTINYPFLFKLSGVGSRYSLKVALLIRTILSICLIDEVPEVNEEGATEGIRDH